MRILICLLFALFSNNLISKDLYEFTGGIFDLPIYILIEEDTTKARIQVIELTDIQLDNEYFNSRATTFYEYGKPIVIWFPEFTKDVSIINHELMHTTIFLLEWAGVPLDYSTQEVYAFTLDYITKQSNEFLKFY